VGEAVIRFEVLVNGRRVCLAGQGGYGCLEVRVQSSRFAGEQPPAPFPPDPPVEELKLTAGGHDFAVGDIGWLQLPVRVGDEVMVRVLGPGPCDPPAEVNAPVGPDDLPF
jgi:hypothetical protein